MRDLPLPPFPGRSPDAHKGDVGRILVLAGSPGFTGAAALAADSAMRAGAGLVTVGTPARCWGPLASRLVEPMPRPLPETADGTLALSGLPEIRELAARHTVLLAGPGLGRHPETGRLVRELLPDLTIPVVADADALTALAEDPGPLGRRRGATVLTPHPGEMARLLGVPVADVQANRERVAAEFAARWRLVVILKGRGTVVTDGRESWQNPTGNAGMATAGSGDVLAGVLAALLGQGVPPFPAARLAAFLHGDAGDRAREELGEASLVASDLIRHLPAAIRTHIQRVRG
ncbi:MAG: NAD(P)H-hydrate dehydratase [Planctomycetales bacterium]|nr:NAD(P)H-hydrate dehydratase [Planctomycetales bacterium]